MVDEFSEVKAQSLCAWAIVLGTVLLYSVIAYLMVVD